MKKSLLAFAALGAVASSTYAQSNVTVYGIVDAGLVYDRASSNRISLASGNQSGSRLGFRGTEDLGGGVSVIFNIENGFNVDNGTGAQTTSNIAVTTPTAPGSTNINSPLIFGRRATVGLSSKEYGTVNFGRRNTPYFNAIDSIDPMNVGFAGNATNLFASTGVRMDNAVIYTSPTLFSLVGEVAYGAGEVAGSSSSNRQLGASLAYAEGPYYAVLAHHSANNNVGTDTRRNTVLGGKFSAESFAVSAAIAKNTGLGTADSRDYLLGLSLPFAARNKLMLSYIRHDDRTATNADSRQSSVAYTYDFSARTNFYTSYAKITNQNGAGATTNTRFGDREFNVGVRHRF